MTVLLNLQLGFDLICVQCKTKMLVGTPANPVHKCPKCGFQVAIQPAQGQPGPQAPKVAVRNMPTFKQPQPLA